MFVRVVGAVMVATGLVAVVPGPASAAEWWESSQTANWYDGQVSYSSVMNCFSVIQGSPYYENGVGAYIGYLADPDNAGGPKPAVNDKTWIRYRVYGMGNPCPGGSYFRPKFYLPVGWTWDTTRQIACGYDGSGGSAPQANCPGWSNMDASNAYWNNGSGQGGNMWGVAQGHYWEFQFPVKVGPNAQSGVILDAHLDVADGNFNPQMLLRTNNVYVFNTSAANNQAAVMYDQPSSYDAVKQPWDQNTNTKYGMVSAQRIVVGNKAGTARFQISTDPAMGSILGTESFSFGSLQYGQSFGVGTDWSSIATQLQPGVTYYWRGRVEPTGGTAVNGEIQSFKLKSGGGVDAVSLSATNSGGGVGTGSGGVAGGVLTPIPVPSPPGPTGPTAPATATSSVAKTAKAKKGVKVTISCTGACTAKAAATVSKKVARKLGLKKGSLGTGKASLTAAGSKVVTIKLSKAVQKKLKRLKKVSATVKVTTTVAGTTSSKTWKVTIKG